MSDGRVRLSEIEAEFSKYFLVGDDGTIPLLMATFIANRLDTGDKPIWLLLVAESSGGKTEYFNIFDKLAGPPYDLSYHIDDLTPNTFLSGMQQSKASKRQGDEVSLLFKLTDKMVFINDFTVLLTKGKESKKEILGQLRTIYAGSFNKETGLGKALKWNGRIGVMAALTPDGIDLMASESGMGERFIAYHMKQPDEKKLGDLLKSNYNTDTNKQKEKVQKMVAEYVNFYVQKAESSDGNFQIEDEVLENLNLVAQFATRARSFVRIDFRSKEATAKPNIEKFPRFVKQLQGIAKGFCLMNDSNKMTEEQKNILYKIALDTVPKERRQLLTIMAKYKQVGTAAISAAIGLPSGIVGGLLSQLTALGLIVRIPHGGKGNENGWRLSKQTSLMMRNFEMIPQSDEILVDEEVAEEENQQDDMKEIAEDAKRIKKEARIAELIKQHDYTPEEAETEYNAEILERKNNEAQAQADFDSF
jgi:hypothetical protein